MNTNEPKQPTSQPVDLFPNRLPGNEGINVVLYEGEYLFYKEGELQ